MKLRLLGLVLGAAMYLASPHAGAAIIEFHADLLGANEFPPVPSAGTGFAIVDIDPAANTMRVRIDFAGLTGNSTVAHIHCCTADPFALNQLAGVATTTPTFPGFPAGVTSGSYDMSFDLTLASSYNPAFVTSQGGTVASAELALIDGIQAGKSYLNVHSTFAPSGEIRGFLIPEPGTVGLLGLGVAVMGALARRSRSSGH